MIFINLDEARIDAVKRHAEDNVITRDVAKLMMAGKAAPPGDDSRFVVEIGLQNYVELQTSTATLRCVYTVEQHVIKMRHLSISASNAPTPPFILTEMVARRFGFWGSMDRDLAHFWLEDIPGPLYEVEGKQVQHKAVNFLQELEPPHAS